VYTADTSGLLDGETGNRRRGDTQIAHVNAGGVEAGNHRSLQHARSSSGVTRDDNVSPEGEQSAECLGRLEGKLRSDVHSDEALYSCIAEDRSHTGGFPDQRRADHRRRLYALVGEDLYSCAYMSAASDDRLVAYDCTHVDEGAGSYVDMAAQNGSGDLGVASHEGVAPHDRVTHNGVCTDHAVVVDDSEITDHRSTSDAHVFADDHSLADRGAVVDLCALSDPQALTCVNTGNVDLGSATEHVAMYLDIAFTTAYVTPVSIHYRAVQLVTGGHQGRKQV